MSDNLNELAEVINNQCEAEEHAQLRCELHSKECDERDALLDQKSCERDKIREVCWKRRFYISWGIGLTCFIITFGTLVNSHDRLTTKLHEQIMQEKRVKHGLRKKVDSLNDTIHKGIVAYSEANKNTDALRAHVENYAKVTISSLSEQTEAQTIVIKELANQITKLTEDEASFAEIIDSLPDEKMAEWNHFANQLKKDEAATVKHIEQEYKKELHEENKKDHAFGKNDPLLRHN